MPVPKVGSRMYKRTGLDGTGLDGTGVVTVEDARSIGWIDGRMDGWMGGGGVWNFDGKGERERERDCGRERNGVIISIFIIVLRPSFHLFLAKKRKEKKRGWSKGEKGTKRGERGGGR